MYRLHGIRAEVKKGIDHSQKCGLDPTLNIELVLCFVPLSGLAACCMGSLALNEFKKLGKPWRALNETIIFDILVPALYRLFS